MLSYLEAEFQTLLARKDATSLTLEPRVRNARYLAELAKFRLYPPGSFFVALKQLLDDFSHHNIDAACTLVETAGRPLIRMPETKIRMENMIEVSRGGGGGQGGRNEQQGMGGGSQVVLSQCMSPMLFLHWREPCGNALSEG